MIPPPSSGSPMASYSCPGRQPYRVARGYRYGGEGDKEGADAGGRGDWFGCTKVFHRGLLGLIIGREDDGIVGDHPIGYGVKGKR